MTEQLFRFTHANEFPMDYVFNGISMKDTLCEFLMAHPMLKIHQIDDEDFKIIAEELKEYLAIKLHLKQGDL